MQVNNEKTTIKFRYHKIHKKTFFENPGYLEKNENKNIGKTGYFIETGMKVEPKDKMIYMDINAKLIKKNDDNDIELLGIETTHEFLIENFDDTIHVDSDHCNLPDQFAVTLLSLSYSSVRGMLFEAATDSNYKNILLPLINPQSIFENMKMITQKK